MSFARVYPLYVAKAEKKGREKSEVDAVICWLTGYNQRELEGQLKKQKHFETFFKEAPKLNPSREAAVMQCYRVSPGPDFVLVVQVADMPAYHALAHRLFASHANVRNVRSFFSIHRSKFETRIAL